ncbi:hypothetical protein BN77_3209 [Rhizobium mesoamericanum STM3625]|uniref:Uncharacterized protein n=1 Tax=Rhizobium mesoamericanum STM3625 TaxID=1211777 RepID=K0PHN4_9HYPH|nr:hypothetical protein BN77_3209 [Rhizobium mesoamericanum STM3625]
MPPLTFEGAGILLNVADNSESPDLVDRPKPVRISPKRCGPRLRVVLTVPCLFRVADTEDPVTVDDMVTTPLQFRSDRRFSSAGTAFDQILLDSHRRCLSCHSINSARRELCLDRFN